MPQALQSVFSPAGPQAEHVLWLITVMMTACAAIWILVAAGVVRACRGQGAARGDPLELEPAAERRSATIIAGLAALTGLCVMAFSVVSFATQARITQQDADALRIRLTARQFWWEALYKDAGPSGQFSTANELTIPVDRQVLIELESPDVIHSLWVPSLMGKQDLVPGQQNQLRFTAAREGVYRGQCAEFCGLQHAHMGMFVRALAPAAYLEWRDNQLRPAAEGPGTAAFMRSGCASCHAVRGTQAGGRMGPDLTHIGSRATIAAGLLPRNRETLAAWIADPQRFKPGARMPRPDVAPDDLAAISGWLDSLK